MTALKYIKWPKCSSAQRLWGCGLEMSLDILMWFSTQGNIFEVGYPHFNFVSFGTPQIQIWHIRNALNKTNVLVTKHLLNFQQPMNHTNSASPARYWLIHWEFPTFQGKWHSDLNEWKSTHLYLPLFLSFLNSMPFICEEAKKCSSLAKRKFRADCNHD